MTVGNYTLAAQAAKKASVDKWVDNSVQLQPYQLARAQFEMQNKHYRSPVQSGPVQECSCGSSSSSSSKVECRVRRSCCSSKSKCAGNCVHHCLEDGQPMPGYAYLHLLLSGQKGWYNCGYPFTFKACAQVC